MPPRKKDNTGKGKLTYQEERFCNLYVYVFNGDGLKSAKEAYNCKDDMSAGKMAHDILNRQIIQEKISELRGKLSEFITPDWIISQAIDLLRDKNPQIKARMVEFLGDTKAMRINKQQVDFTDNSQDALERAYNKAINDLTSKTKYAQNDTETRENTLTPIENSTETRVGGVNDDDVRSGTGNSANQCAQNDSVVSDNDGKTPDRGND